MPLGQMCQYSGRSDHWRLSLVNSSSPWFHERHRTWEMGSPLLRSWGGAKGVNRPELGFCGGSPSSSRFHSRALPLIEAKDRRVGMKEDRMADEEGRALKDHIVRLYCERYTCRQIADLTAQTYPYVRDSLKERGITPHNRARRCSRVK